MTRFARQRTSYPPLRRTKELYKDVARQIARDNRYDDVCLSRKRSCRNLRVSSLYCLLPETINEVSILVELKTTIKQPKVEEIIALLLSTIYWRLFVALSHSTPPMTFLRRGVSLTLRLSLRLSHVFFRGLKREKKI